MNVITELRRAGAKVHLSMTARAGFAAPPGHVIASVDFSGQELFIAGWTSQDEKILNSFLVPENLPLLGPDGKQLEKDGKLLTYKNPDSDLHTITAQSCCFPHLFEGQPIEKWVSIAKDKSLIKQKGSPRDYSKRTNFGILYMQTAKAMSELYHFPEATCAEWIKKHEQTYVGFHRFAKEIGNLSQARGWSRNPDGRIRYVGEDNAKSAGASPARSGVNFQIQGYGASQIKLSEMYLQEFFIGTKARLCILVHDELVCVVPGRVLLNEEKSLLENGVYKPIYEPDEEAKYWASSIQKIMEDAQKETFGGTLEGRAESTIAPVWSK